MSDMLNSDLDTRHRLVGVYRNVIDSGWLGEMKAVADESGVADIRDPNKVRLHLFTDAEIGVLKRYPLDSQASVDGILESVENETVTSTLQCMHRGLWVIRSSGGIIVNLSAAQVFNAERESIGKAVKDVVGFQPLIDKRDIGVHIGRNAAGVPMHEVVEVLEPVLPKIISFLPVKLKTIPVNK